MRLKVHIIYFLVKNKEIKMGEYEIFTFEEDVNEFVVFLNTTEDLYFLQDEIMEKISSKNKTVLVDLFLRNGFTFNRYILLKIDSNNKFKSFIINPREVSEKIKKKVENYLKEHSELLYSSSLSQNEIEFIVNR